MHGARELPHITGCHCYICRPVRCIHKGCDHKRCASALRAPYGGKR